MPSTRIIAACLALTWYCLAAADTGPDELICNNSVIARLPPSLSNSENPAFMSTPRGYFSGLWYSTYSSTIDRSGIKNVQLVSVYNSTADKTSDVTSYQIIKGSCPHIYTTYAVDNDTPTQADNYPLHLPGTNQTIMTDILADGLDSDCHRYFVSFNAGPAMKGITISSQVQDGPSKGTLRAIKKALLALGNKVITKEVKALKKVPDDGTRSGLPDFVCGPACLMNRNNYDGTCASSG